MANFMIGAISGDALAKLSAYTTQFIVLSQSVPAGSLVPEGTVINVVIAATGSVTVKDVLEEALPAALGDMTLADVNNLLTQDPNLKAMASDPTVLTDATKRTAFITAFNTASGSNVLTTNDAKAGTDAVRLLGG